MSGYRILSTAIRCVLVLTFMAGTTMASGDTYPLSGEYTLDGGTATFTDTSFSSDTDDVSAIYVTNGGDLTLVNPTIATTGNTSSNDASSFYGLNAAVLADTGSQVTITGGSITTKGTGANGAFPTGSGTKITLSDVTIQASGGGGHGVMATNGATLELDKVDIATTGANSAPLATDRGGGTVIVTGGTVTSSGADSPGIYSTGDIQVTGGTVDATGAEAAVVEGFNSITLTDTDLTGAKGTRDRGIMLYQSMSGDADTGVASISMDGGSFTWPSTTGPAFYVTNTKAVITLTGTTVKNSAGTLLKASAGDWGTSGSNGGDATLIADGVTLTGSLTADSISSVSATLRNGATLSGAITSASLTLDSSSVWEVTGDSVLTTLADSSGITGSTISNIAGNGYTVYYDSALSGNRYLGGGTYSLVNGGTLIPSGSNVTPTPTTLPATVPTTVPTTTPTKVPTLTPTPTTTTTTPPAPPVPTPTPAPTSGPVNPVYPMPTPLNPVHPTPTPVNPVHPTPTPLNPVHSSPTPILPVFPTFTPVNPTLFGLVSSSQSDQAAAQAYSAESSPVITRITPRTGSRGQWLSPVVITMKNMNGTNYPVSVWFTGDGLSFITAEKLIAESPSPLTCTVLIPKDAQPGEYTLYVKLQDGAEVEKEGVFTIRIQTTGAPVITSITPRTVVSGSNAVTVTLGGSNFHPGSEVTMNAADTNNIPVLSVSVEDAGTITFIPDLSGVVRGFASLTVTNPDGLQGTRSRAIQVI